MTSKLDFRKRMLDERAALPDRVRDEEDRLIAEALISLPQFADAECLLSYFSFGNEVDTHQVIEHALALGKTVGLPRCIDGTRDMRWFEFDGASSLEKSEFGMEEPQPESCREITDAEYSKMRCLAIVPGVAFDAHGYRIGYGGGFYDRFLESFTGISVGLCRSAFLSDDLYRQKIIDRHDLPVDIVVTPKSVLQPGMRRNA